MNVNHLRMRDCIHKTEFFLRTYIYMYMMSDDANIPILMTKKTSTLYAAMWKSITF